MFGVVVGSVIQQSEYQSLQSQSMRFGTGPFIPLTAPSVEMAIY